MVLDQRRRDHSQRPTTASNRHRQIIIRQWPLLLRQHRGQYHRVRRNQFLPVHYRGILFIKIVTRGVHRYRKQLHHHRHHHRLRLQKVSMFYFEERDFSPWLNI